MKCKGLDANGNKASIIYGTSGFEAYITQTGEIVAIDGQNIGRQWLGQAFPTATNSTKGTLGVVDCDNDGIMDAFQGFDEVAGLKIVTNTSGTARLSGRSYMVSDQFQYACKWKLQRTDVADPGVSACLP